MKYRRFQFGGTSTLRGRLHPRSSRASIASSLDENFTQIDSKPGASQGVGPDRPVVPALACSSQTG